MQVFSKFSNRFFFEPQILPILALALRYFCYSQHADRGQLTVSRVVVLYFGIISYYCYIIATMLYYCCYHA